MQVYTVTARDRNEPPTLFEFDTEARTMIEAVARGAEYLWCYVEPEYGSAVIVKVALRDLPLGVER